MSKENEFVPGGYKKPNYGEFDPTRQTAASTTENYVPMEQPDNERPQKDPNDPGASEAVE